MAKSPDAPFPHIATEPRPPAPKPIAPDPPSEDPFRTPPTNERTAGATPSNVVVVGLAVPFGDVLVIVAKVMVAIVVCMIPLAILYFVINPR